MNRPGRQLVGALLALAVAGPAGARTLVLTDLDTMMMACIHADHPRSSWTGWDSGAGQTQGRR